MRDLSRVSVVVSPPPPSQRYGPCLRSNSEGGFPSTTPGRIMLEYKSCFLEVFQNKRKRIESALSQSAGARRFTGQNFRET